MNLQNLIRQAIEIGRLNGFVTFDQLNELLEKKVGPEDIETVLEALSAEGIRVVDA